MSLVIKDKGCMLYLESEVFMISTQTDDACARGDNRVLPEDPHLMVTLMKSSFYGKGHWTVMEWVARQ